MSHIWEKLFGQPIWPSFTPRELPTPAPWLAVALILLAVTVAGLAMGRRQRPYFAVGWLWYLGMLVPVIGLVQVGVQAMADRYTYVPMVGLSIALVWTVADLVENRAALRTAAAVLAAIWRLPRSLERHSGRRHIGRPAARCSSTRWPSPETTTSSRTTWA